MNQLDKEMLMIALKGQYRNNKAKEVWMQEVIKTVADLISSLQLKAHLNFLQQFQYKDKYM